MLLLAGSIAAAASATTIEFATLSNNTVVSNQFAGVSFSVSGGQGQDGSPLASSDWGGGSVELLNSTTSNYPSNAFLNIAFSSAQSGVSFRFNNYGTSEAGRGASSWTAYNASNTVVSSGFLGFTNDYSLQSVGGSGITSLVITNGTEGTDSWIFGVSELTFGAVPEPATWSLMIVGFGAVGATMRRRQTVTA